MSIPKRVAFLREEQFKNFSPLVGMSKSVVKSCNHRNGNYIKSGNYPSTFSINGKFNAKTEDLSSSDTEKANKNGRILFERVDEDYDQADYNPFEHRSVDHSNNSLGCIIHLIKSSLGVGILAMPSAFKHSGLLFGIFGTIITGIICSHCVQMLVSTSHQMCKKMRVPTLDFSQTAEAVFLDGPERTKWLAPTAKIVVNTALIITYYFGFSVYIVLVSESIKQLMDYHYPDLRWNISTYILIIYIPLILTCQIRTLKYLVPLSFLANSFLVISFAMTLFYLFVDIPSLEDRALFSSFDKLPLYFSTVVFAMEGIGAVLPIENSMQKPQEFLGCPGVLNIAMSFVVTIYTAMGFFGYLRFGEETAGSVTFNLPIDDVLAQVAKGLIALSVFFSYSLQFYIAWDITWRKILQPKIPSKMHNISQILIRTLMVTLVVCEAALVPNLDLIITLVGSICFSVLGIFIPALIHALLICAKDMDWKDKLVFYKDIFLVFFSLFILFSGSYFSIVNLTRQ